MKKQIQAIVAILLILGGGSTLAQNALNMTQLGHLSYNEDLSEVRGALHNGREYALVGAHSGLSIVDVTNPATPTEVFFESGPNSIWRDPFYHNNHAFCVTEGGGGLLIVDMSPLPGSQSLTTTLYTGSSFPFSSAHNMFIDGPNNRAYIFGTNTIDGAIILDISNPMNPTELGIWNDHYIHDGFVRGDTLWAACLEEGVFVVNVANAGNPVVLSNWDTPSEFSHNVWPSDDNANCYTTDEVTSGYVAGYDMSNLQNVVETDKVRHPLSEGVIPHNAHFFNDYVITSHYRDGVTIHDVSDPSNIVLTGYFDSSPLSGNGFNGSWGAWPYLPSGNVLVSDIEEGLFVLGVDYQRAARLQGTVTEFGSGNPLNAVQIDVVGTGINELTDLFGEYATGMAAGGTFDVTFQKGGYLSQTISGVVTANGQTIILDVELVPDVPFTVSGNVSESGVGTPIEGATILFENEFFTKELTTDANGDYSDNNFFAGEYDVTVGAWGYVGECSTVSITASGTPPSFELLPGYSDDFALDLGWVVSGNANIGVWERGVPVGTTLNGQFSNPDSDAGSVCGNQSYITGNGGGSVGDDDVDDGVTILTSPLMDLTIYAEPTVTFDYWFFNQGGNESPNDTYLVKMNNGATEVTLFSLPVSSSQWKAFSMPISQFIDVTSTMQLILEAEDATPGHLVEGGIDNFRISETTGIQDSEAGINVVIFPNPAKEFVNINISKPFDAGYVQLYDMAGKAIGNQQTISNGANVLQFSVAAGIYICEVVVDGKRQLERLSIHH
ncbi:MAG: choice-of-anchor B family protein [Flavobacteriales bacterium]|nr:choice-of-anchor B family protein [Flavobacteriales bacterium]